MEPSNQMDPQSDLSTSNSKVLDPTVASYFDRIVPHRVFIQHGDTFIGKNLILLFQSKKFAQATAPSTEVSTTNPSLDQEVQSFVLEEEEQATTEYLVPDEVFQGFLKPENIRSDDDEQFWDYEMLGEFSMDLVSDQDYEHVLSLESDKMRKQYLYSLFRKLKVQNSEKELKENDEKETSRSRSNADSVDENAFVEISYEIYTSFIYPDQLGKGDRRFAYLNDVKVIQISNSDVIQTCGIIVFNIFTSNEPSELGIVRETMESIIPNYKIDPALTPKNQHILVISNLLTWALTKQLYDEEGVPKPFHEKRFKKRTPHPDYEHVFEFENFCITSKTEVKNNKNLRIHVIGSGIPYGLGEDIFYHWFALGYKTEYLTTLPVINKGENVVPTIHIDELIKIIDNMVDNPRSVKKAYCIAMENETNTLEEIITALSKIFTKSELVDNMTTEEFQASYPEDLLYTLNQKKTALDLLITHLPMESNFMADFAEEMNLQQGSFIDNIRKTSREFYKFHKLTSVKILIHGPKACGKSELARKLADHYGLKYLNPEDFLESQTIKLKEKIQYCEQKIELHRMASNRSDVSSFGENEEGQSLEDPSINRLNQQIMAHMEELKELDKLTALRKSKSRAKRAAFERGLGKMYEKILRTKYVEWHGYVMDGWPNTNETCNLLFSKSEETSEEEIEESEHENGNKDETDQDENSVLEMFDKILLPEIVVSLEGCAPLLSDHSDLFMTDLHPESVHELDITKVSVTSMYSLMENEDNKNDFYNPDAFIQFFNNIDIFPLIFNVEEKSIDEIYENLLARFGRPRSLLGEDYRRELDEKMRLDTLCLEQLQADVSRMAEKKKEEAFHRMEQWADMNNILHYERNVIQELHRLPLRQYLIKYVMPIVTRGMNDVTQTKPDNPISYLVEYFFKENREFKITNAHHNAKAERFWQCLAFMKSKLKEM